MSTDPALHTIVVDQPIWLSTESKVTIDDLYVDNSTMGLIISKAITLLKIYRKNKKAILAIRGYINNFVNFLYQTSNAKRLS